MDFIQRLKGLFPDDERARVVGALRRNPAVWQALRDDAALAERAVSELGSDPKNWTPAKIMQLDTTGSFSISAPAVPADVLDHPASEQPMAAALLSELDAKTLLTDAALPLDLGLHAIFSRPHLIDEHIAELKAALTALPRAKQTRMIEAAQSFDEAVAVALAKSMLNTASEDTDSVDAAVQRAHLLKLAGKDDEALDALNAAWTAAAEAQVALARSIAAQSEDESTARLAVERAQKAAKALPDPERALQSIHMRKSVNTPQEALSEARTLLERVEAGDAGVVTLDELVAGAETLLVHGERKGATVLAEAALAEQPNEVVALAAAARGYAHRDDRKSVEYAQLASTLRPSDGTLQATLKDTLVDHQRWTEALIALDEMIVNDAAPSHTLWLEKGQTAVEAGQSDTAIAAAKHLLAKNEADGEAMALMSAALRIQGDVASALTYAADATHAAPKSANVWLAHAEALIANEDDDAAQDTLRAGINAVADPEGKALLHARLSELHLAAGDAKNALSESNHAHKLVGDDLATARRIGLPIVQAKALLAAEEGQQAVDVLQPVAREYPQSPGLSRVLGEAYLAVGDVHLAAEALSKAVMTAPEDGALHLALGKALLASEHSEAQAIEHIRAAQDLDADKPEAAVLLAEAHLQAGHTEKAMGLFQTASTLDDAYRLRARKGLARAALRSNQAEIAITTLQDELAENRNDIEMQKILCEAYFKAGLGDSAREALTNVYAQAGENADTLLWIAKLAQQLEQPELAQTSLEKCLPETLNNTQRLTLSDLLLDNRKTGEAEAALSKLLDDASTPTHILQGAGNLWLTHGESSRAIPYLTKAAERTDWQSPAILGDLCDAYSDNGAHAHALEMVEKQLALDPETPALLHRKASLQTAMGEPEAALDTLEAALALDPENRDVQLDTAIALVGIGQLARALELAEQAYAQQPEDERFAYLTAALNQAAMNDSRVRELIGAQETPAQKLNWILLQAEIAAADGDDEHASGLLASLDALAGDHPRTLALHSLLAENAEHALNHYNKAYAAQQVIGLEAMSALSAAQIELAVAEAAGQLQLWEDAIGLTESAASRIEGYAYAEHKLATLLIARAEFWTLAKELGLHTPEAREALGASSKDRIDALLDGSAATPALRERAPWVFNGETPTAMEINDAALAAAWTGAMRRADQFAGCPAVVNDFANVPAVAAQLALGWLESDPDASMAHAEAALNAELHNALWHVLAGKAAAANDLHVAAHNHYHDALAIEPDVAVWQLWAAQAARAAGNVEEAIAHVEDALANDGDDVALLELLGELQLESAQTEQAAFALRKAVDLAPEKPSLWKKLADVNLSMGFIHEAEQAARHFAEALPKSLEPLALLVRIAMQAGDTDKADRLLQRAGRQASQHPELLMMQSRLAREKGNALKALQLIDRAIQAADRPLPLLLERAELVGEIDGAKAKLNTLAALDKQFPQQTHVLANLAKSQMAAGDHKAAIKSAYRALKADQGELSGRERAALHYDIGQLLGTQGQLDQALNQFSLALKANPGNVDTLLALGKTHTQRRELSQALKAYDRAIEIDPEDARAYCEAAKVLKDTRDYERAEHMLRRAKQISPDDLEINRLLSAMMTLNLVHAAQVAA